MVKLGSGELLEGKVVSTQVDIPKSEDTMPKLLRRRATQFPHRPALRKKRYGIWNTYTWQEYYQNVKDLTLGLLSLGLQRGESIAIIGDNDPEWWFAALAANAAGCTQYGVFVDCVPAEVQYFVACADATFVFAKDQEQVDKLLEIKEQIPKVRRVIYWEKKGMWAYNEPWLLEIGQLQELGREFGQAHPCLFDESVDAGGGDDVFCYSFTSGTTNNPKAAMITHRAWMLRILALWQFFPWKAGDYFSFLCPAWGIDQMLGICAPLMNGTVVNFPEGPQTIPLDSREIAAPLRGAGARAWEELSRDIRVRQADADFIKRLCYQLCLPVGLRMVDLAGENKKPGLLLRLLNLVADWLVFRPLRDQMGFTRPRLCMVAGSMLSPELMRFFRAVGIPLVNQYGSTEASYVSMEVPGAMRTGSTGKVMPGREVRVTQDGELAVRIDEHAFSGYYGRPDATAAVLREDGWYYTGDAGYIDEDGYLYFLDRIQELMAMADGTKFSATNIESRLRFSPYIKDAMVLGDRRDFVSALVNVDLGNVGKWAEKRHITYTTFVDLTQRPEVLDLIEGEIIHVNQALPGSWRVSRFVNIHKEFDPDEAEMTRTRKLKREVLERKYGELVSAIYSPASDVTVTTEVKYRDGRMGTISARLQVRDVQDPVRSAGSSTKSRERC